MKALKDTHTTYDTLYDELITLLYIIFEGVSVCMGCAALFFLARTNHRSHSIIWLIVLFGISQEVIGVIMDFIRYKEQYPDSELKCKTVPKLSTIMTVVVVYFITLSAVKRRFTVKIIYGFVADAYVLWCMWSAVGQRTMNCYNGKYTPGFYWTPLHVTLYCPLDITLCSSFLTSEYLLIYLPALLIHLYLQMTRKDGKIWEMRIVNSYHDQTPMPCSRCERHNGNLQRVILFVFAVMFIIRPICLIHGYINGGIYYEIISNTFAYCIYFYICMQVLGTRRLYRRLKF